MQASLVAVQCEQNWEVAEELRAYVNTFVLRRFGSTVAQRVSLASHELLANAVRFGAFSGPVRFELTHCESQHTLSVRVTNTAVPVRIEVLEKRVAQLAAQDPAVAYAAALQESLDRSAGFGPMLGLLRVVHEASMAVDLIVNGTQVTVIAQGADQVGLLRSSSGTHRRPSLSSLRAIELNKATHPSTGARRS